MGNQIEVDDQVFQQVEQGSIGRPVQITTRLKILYWVIFVLGLIFLLVSFGTFYLSKGESQPNLQSPKNSPPTETTKSAIVNNYYKLSFKESSVVLTWNDPTKIKGSLWELPVKIVDSMDDQPVGGNLYYVKPQDIFYDVQPGGFSTLSLISEKDLKFRVKNERTKYKQVVCEVGDLSLGIKARTIRCTTTNVNPEDPRQIDESFIKNCYLPLEDGRYLAYEQKIKPMGDVDLCTSLAIIGIQAIKTEPKFDVNYSGTKIVEVLVQDGSYYGPPFDPNLYQLETLGTQPLFHFFAKSEVVNLEQYLGKRIKVHYREIKGVVMGEQQLVVVDSVE